MTPAEILTYYLDAFRTVGDRPVEPEAINLTPKTKDDVSVMFIHRNIVLKKYLV